MVLSKDIIGSRVEEQRVRKMRTLLNLNRIFAAAIFISGFVLVISSIDTSVWNFRLFWYGLKFLIFLFELLFLLVGYGIAKMLGYDDVGAVAIMTAIHNAIFGGNTEVLGIELGDLVTNPLQIPTDQSIVDSFFAFFIIITLAIALISGLGFLRECNPALSAISFFAMNIVMGLASLNGKLLIDESFNTGSIIQMIFSKLVITAFIIYLFLELSFQASYIYNVIGPNILRHKRISSNIRRIKEFRMPIGNERKQPGEEENANNNRIRNGTTVGGTNTTQSRLKVTAAFSKIRGMIGKKLFRINAEEDWDKMNSRLKNYYQKLEENDPLISVSLSASAYTPSVPRLLLIITTGTIFRMGSLALLSWLALNPVPILQFLNLPDSIINSVEASQPEMIILVLAPMAAMFLLIGLFVQFIQKRATKRVEKYRDDQLVIHSISDERKKERRSRRNRRSTQPPP